MPVKVLALLIALIPAIGVAQGYAGLGTDADGFQTVRPDRPFTFPDDHGPHPGFRIEWWYLTANLSADDGTPMGLQWTLFRQALRPDDTAKGWQSAQVWMGHAAVTTPDDHKVAERFARGGVGQAGARAAPFEAWIDDWRMTSTAPDGADGLSALDLSARGNGFAYALSLTAEGPTVPQGDRGYSVKSDAGQASHYYSQPFYRLTGTVTLDGRDIAVTGRAWLDREWSTQPLTEDQTGWDWFALHLPGGEKLMAYQLRHADGSTYAPGTFTRADGTPEPLADGAFVIEPLETTDIDGRQVPTRWRLALPAKGIDLEVGAINPQSFMTTAFPYWEGPVRYEGTHQGVGYLEMTGYGDED